jgi:hypothetical protein
LSCLVDENKALGDLLDRKFEVIVSDVVWTRENQARPSTEGCVYCELFAQPFVMMFPSGRKFWRVRLHIVKNPPRFANVQAKEKKTLLTLYWFFFCSLPLISALLFSLLAKCLFHRESAHKSLFFRKQWNCPRGAFFYLYIFPRHVPALDTRNLITRYHTRGARLPPCPRLCNLKQSSGMTCLL